MLLLNPTRFLLHEYERESGMAYKKKRRPGKSHTFKSVISHYLSSMSLYFRSIILKTIIKSEIKRDYRIFLKGSSVRKDEIYAKWESIKDIIYSKPNVLKKFENSTIRTKHGVNNVREALALSLSFEKKLQKEYNNFLNSTLSQEYLRDLASKFSHLPQEMIDDLIHDEYSESH